jgi:hypothetical protein
MTPQLAVSLMIVILMALEVSFMLLESSIVLLENIYSKGITYDDYHLQSSYIHSTGHRANGLNFLPTLLLPYLNKLECLPLPVTSTLV